MGVQIGNSARDDWAGARRLGKGRYGTPVTLIDEPLSTMVADALQAAVFRGHLVAQRKHLVEKTAEIRTMINRRSDTRRLRAVVASNEAEIRQIDSMILRLQHRFGPPLGHSDEPNYRHRMY